MRHRAAAVALLAGLLLGIVAGLRFSTSDKFVAPVPTMRVQFSGDTTGALSALGTIGAVVVALAFGVAESHRATRAVRETAALRAEQRERERLRTPSLVAGWVTDNYVDDPLNSVYVRKVTAHVANESDDPVYNVTVNVQFGNPPTVVGPLAVPLPIPVVPAPARTDLGCVGWIPAVPARRQSLVRNWILRPCGATLVP